MEALIKNNIGISQITGNIHSVETCGTVDGPGIRYVIFTQGCPLRCQYCHNPDTWDMDRNGSTVMSVQELMEDIIKYKPFMEYSGGGITLSGGEPLMQANFATALFKMCKENGIHTALDTSGYAPVGLCSPVFHYTDLTLLDIKSGNAENFHKITGRSIEPVKATARYLSDTGVPMWIRFVLVPNLSDCKKDIEALAEFISSLKTVEKVEVLPFHKMGEYKWSDLGLDYSLTHTQPPSAESIEVAKSIFRKSGLCTN